MAIGTPVSRGTGSGTTSATTASFTPSANVTLIAAVAVRRNTAAAVQPTISDSASLSWTEIVDVNYDTAANPRIRNRVFWAAVGGSPVAMTVTGSSTSATGTGIVVTEVSGVDTAAFTNVASATDTAGDPSVTLGSSPAASSAVLAWFYGVATNAVAPPTGFTETDDFNFSTTRFEVAYDTTTPGTGAAWTTSNTYSIGIALELVEAAGAAYTLTADAGSYALTGTAATLKFGRAITASPGSYSLTGTAATFPRTYIMTAAGGAYVLTGVAATLVPPGATVTPVYRSVSRTGNRLTYGQAVNRVARGGSISRTYKGRR